MSYSKVSHRHESRGVGDTSLPRTYIKAPGHGCVAKLRVLGPHSCPDEKTWSHQSRDGLEARGDSQADLCSLWLGHERRRSDGVSREAQGLCCAWHAAAMG